MINDKLMGYNKNKNMRNEIYKESENSGKKSIVVENLTLSKTPYDTDLIRLIPSNNAQSWEIRLVLYYSEILTSKIQAIINFDCEQLYKINPTLKRLSKDYLNNSTENNVSANNRSSIPKEKTFEDRLKTLKDNLIILRNCFENLTAYCLNMYSRK